MEKRGKTKKKNHQVNGILTTTNAVPATTTTKTISPTSAPDDPERETNGNSSDSLISKNNSKNNSSCSSNSSASLKLQNPSSILLSEQFEKLNVNRQEGHPALLETESDEVESSDEPNNSSSSSSLKMQSSRNHPNHPPSNSKTAGSNPSNNDDLSHLPSPSSSSENNFDSNLVIVNHDESSPEHSVNKRNNSTNNSSSLPHETTQLLMEGRMMGKSREESEEGDIAALRDKLDKLEVSSDNFNGLINHHEVPHPRLSPKDKDQESSSQLEQVLNDSSAVTPAAKAEPLQSIEDYGIQYISYESELQMSGIMKLIQKDLSEPYSVYTYRYFIHNWPKLCFLAMDEEKLVGVIVCKLDVHKQINKRGYIAMLAVDEKYRRKKIGSNLVLKSIRAMAEEDADEIVLETEITNKSALRLYENLGFVRDKRLFRYYLNGVDALRLKLWLK